MPSVVTVPADLVLGPGCGMGQQRFDQADVSDSDGSTDVRVRGRPRWILRLQPPQKLKNNSAEGRRWQKMILDLQGRVNVLAAYDPLRRNPIGGAWTGTPQTSTVLARGSTSVTLAAGTPNNGKQLQAEDLMQIDAGFGTSELVRVVSATVVSGGSCSVVFDPPCRVAHAVGTNVTLTDPRGYFRNNADQVSWTYTNQGTTVEGLSLDLMETWR